MSTAGILGRFVWHELLTSDTDAAAAFYPRVAPWRTAPSNMPGYTIWMSGATQVGGLMALPPDGGATPPHWIVYVGTPDVDGTATRAQALGARIVKVPVDIPNVGRFAVLTDPQGATFALFMPRAGQAPAPHPPLGGFSWHELATTEPEAALRFYAELFGWTKGVAHDMGPMGVYQVFEHAGQAVGGICRPGSMQSAPSWLSYVHVSECARAAAAAKAAGGRLLHGPVEVPGGSWIALLADPQGGCFAVHEPPHAMIRPREPAATATATPAPTTPAASPAKPPRAPAPAAPTAARTPAKRRTAKRKAAKRKPVARKAAPRKAAKRKSAARTSAKRKPAKRKPAARKAARRSRRRPRR